MTLIDALFVLVFGAFLSPIIGVFFQRFRHYFVSFVTFVSFVIVLLHSNFAPLAVDVLWKAPPLGIMVAIDGFNYLVLLLVSGLGFLIAFFASGYMRENDRVTYYNTLYLLMLAGIVGVVISGDLFNIYVFFEIASISSYVLVAYHADKGALRAAMRYLVMGSLGTGLALIGIVFIYAAVGSLNIADIAVKIATVQSPLLYLALAFFLTGFGIKAAFAPLHAWKPDALSHAPTPAAALLAGCSGIMAVYVMFRIFFTLFTLNPFPLTFVFQFFAVLTMILGALLAFRQDDIKKLLAFSGISQVGYVFLAVSFSTAAGVFAGLFQLLNLAIAEVLLFLCAGLVVKHAGSKRLSEMSGLSLSLPLTSIGLLVGAASIIGIPIFSGFISKILIYQAGFDSGFLVVTILSLAVSALTLGYFLKLIFSLTGPEMAYNGVSELEPHIFMPLVVLILLCIIFGIFPDLVYPLLGSASSALLDPTAYLGVIK